MLRQLVLFAAWLLIFPVEADAQSGREPSPGADQRLLAMGEALLSRLTAQQFDARLPAVGLKPWLSSLLGKRAEIGWSTADCGDEGGAPGPGSEDAPADQDAGAQTTAAGSALDSPLCTEAQALFYGPDGRPSLDRYVVVQVLVGTDRSGVNLDAASYGPGTVSVFVFDGTTMRTLDRLGDLPPALADLK